MGLRMLSGHAWAGGVGMAQPCALLGFARQVAHRVLFMDEGRLVEEGTPAELFDTPREERTRRFLSNVL